MPILGFLHPRPEGRGFHEVRDFWPGDLGQVAEIMTLAFGGKFQSLAPMPREEMPQFLTETGVIYSSPFPGYIVAEVDGEVAGVLALK